MAIMILIIRELKAHQVTDLTGQFLLRGHASTFTELE